MKSDKAIGALLVGTKALESGEEVYYFQATVGTKDREGELVTVDGWDFGSFLKNPVFMIVHDYEQLPIGKIVELEPNDIGFKIGVVFDEEDELAVKVKRKYDRGFMNAVSVGFIRKETTGKRAGKDWVTTKKELLEVSAVPIPGHPDALMIRKDIEGMEEQMGTKSVDFTTALTLNQARNNMWDNKWAIERALEQANESVLSDTELDREGKLAAIGSNFDQFKTAILGWYGGYIDVKEMAVAAGLKMVQPEKPGETVEPGTDEVGTKAGRAISQKNGDALKAAIKSLDDVKSAIQSVLGEEAAEAGDDPKGKEDDDAEDKAKKGSPEVAVSEDTLSALKAFIGNKEDN